MELYLFSFDLLVTVGIESNSLLSFLPQDLRRDELWFLDVTLGDTKLTLCKQQCRRKVLSEGVKGPWLFFRKIIREKCEVLLSKELILLHRKFFG